MEHTMTTQPNLNSLLSENLEEKSNLDFEYTINELFSTKSTSKSFDLLVSMISNAKRFFGNIYDKKDEFTKDQLDILNECDFLCSNSILEFKLIFGAKFNPTNKPTTKLYSKSFFNGSWECKDNLTVHDRKLYFKGIGICDITSQEMFDGLYGDELVREILYWMMENNYPTFGNGNLETVEHNELTILNDYFQPRHLHHILDQSLNGGFHDSVEIYNLLSKTIPKTNDWKELQFMSTQNPDTMI